MVKKKDELNKWEKNEKLMVHILTMLNDFGYGIRN